MLLGRIFLQPLQTSRTAFSEEKTSLLEENSATATPASDLRDANERTRPVLTHARPSNADWAVSRDFDVYSYQLPPPLSGRWNNSSQFASVTHRLLRRSSIFHGGCHGARSDGSKEKNTVSHVTTNDLVKTSNSINRDGCCCITTFATMIEPLDGKSRSDHQAVYDHRFVALLVFSVHLVYFIHSEE